MMVMIKTLTGATLVLELEPTDYISHVKAIIEDKEGVPQNEQRLIFSGLQLQDYRRLSDYHITMDGSTIHLTGRLLGR